MAGSLLGQLGALATPQVLDQVSKMTGVDASQLNTGLGAAGATALGSMANQAGSADGLSSLMDMVTKAGASATASGDSGDALGGIMNSILGGGSGGGSNALLSGLLGSALGGAAGGGAAGGITNAILGSGSNAIGSTLSKSLGFNASPLLTMAVPALLGMVTKATKGGNLDANGLKAMLTDQSAAFMNDPANAQTAKLVTSALDAGKESAANQAKYTGAGIAAIKAAPLAAVAMVEAASPSKGAGAAAEFTAAANALSHAAGNAAPASLLNSLFGGGVSQEELNAVVGQIGSGDPLALIKSGIDQLSQGNPDEVAGYKTMILSAAQAAAEATKEGGFLGIGGQQVSDAEQAVLDNLRRALA